LNVVDEWIEGFHLPKGTAIFLNVWGLHHDETRFPDHDVFDPAHFDGKVKPAAEYSNADADMRDHYGYGNGRRICPGIHLADRNLFHAIAKILWAFNIEPGVDPVTEKPVKPNTDVVTGYREGLTTCPDTFPLKLTIRSETRRKAVLEAFQDAQDNVFKQYEEMDFF
jgi:cytochrome P450 family 619